MILNFLITDSNGQWHIVSKKLGAMLCLSLRLRRNSWKKLLILSGKRKAKRPKKQINVNIVEMAEREKKEALLHRADARIDSFTKKLNSEHSPSSADETPPSHPPRF